MGQAVILRLWAPVLKQFHTLCWKSGKVLYTFLRWERRNICGLHKKNHENTLLFWTAGFAFFFLYTTDDQGISKEKGKNVYLLENHSCNITDKIAWLASPYQQPVENMYGAVKLQGRQEHLPQTSHLDVCQDWKDTLVFIASDDFHYKLIVSTFLQTSGIANRLIHHVFQLHIV